MALLLNLDHQDIEFSTDPVGGSVTLRPDHFAVLNQETRALKVEGEAMFGVVELDVLPASLPPNQQFVGVYPVPGAAQSLIECLISGESGKVPVPQMVRALVELLSPGIFADCDRELGDFKRYISQLTGEQLSTEEMAASLGVSPDRLREMTQSALGMTPVAYLRQERNLLARDLLATTSISIEQIAERTGYSDRSSFSRAFAAANGISPNAFRESTSMENL